jgi:hypothetical protein
MQVRSLDKTLALQFAFTERGKCRSTLGELASLPLFATLALSPGYLPSNKPNAVSTVHPSLKTCAIWIRHHIVKPYAGSLSHRMTHVLPQPPTTLPCEYGPLRRPARNASLPAMDGMSSALNDTQRWACSCRVAKTISSSSGIPALGLRSRHCTYLVLCHRCMGHALI